MNPPTLTDFLAWVRAVMGIPVIYLPDAAPALSYAFWTAMAIVNPAFQCIGSPAPGSPPNLIYTQMVYNLAGDRLLNWAPDVQPPPTPPFKIGEDGQPIGYFQYLRQDMNINGFVPGVITASADESTSESLQVVDGLKTLTVGQLQNLKTPWGRTYIGYAQDYGTLWGLT